MGLLLGLITYISWGTGDIFGVYASRKVGAYVTTASVFIFGFIVASLYIPFALDDFFKITPLLFGMNFLFGIALLFGNFLINEGFKRSNASLVGIIVQSFPAVVLLLSALIFKDFLTTKQILWTFVIFAGVFLCTINFNDFKNSKLFTDSGIRLAFIAMLMFSIYFTFFRIFNDAYGWFWSNYISIATFPVALYLAKRIFKAKEKITIPKSQKVLTATFLSALLLRGGDTVFNIGLAKGLASSVTPLAGASPTLFILLSSFLFKDPITKQQKLGIGITIVGIILLSFFSQ